MIQVFIITSMSIIKWATWRRIGQSSKHVWTSEV